VPAVESCEIAGLSGERRPQVDAIRSIGLHHLHHCRLHALGRRAQVEHEPEWTLESGPGGVLLHPAPMLGHDGDGDHRLDQARPDRLDEQA